MKAQWHGTLQADHKVVVAGYGLPRLALALVATAVLLGALLMTPTTSSAAPSNGWGFGIADTSGPPWRTAAGDVRFEDLKTKVFRIQVPYDVAIVDGRTDIADSDPRTWLSIAKRSIINARRMGVQHVLVTFCMRSSDYLSTIYGTKKEYPNAHIPSPEEYDYAIRQAIQALDPLVDAWSPANEPNGGWQWLGNAHDADGPPRLAAFYNKLLLALPPGDEIVSPEFHDKTNSSGVPVKNTFHSDNRSEVRHYMEHYYAAGGRWGHHAAFHPYGGIARANTSSIDDFIGTINGAADVWLTEIGARDHPSIAGVVGVSQQMSTLVNKVSSDSRIGRAYYYNLHADGSSWDSALLDQWGNARSIWYTWCGATRNVPPMHCILHDVPVPGNYDSDPEADVAVFRPHEGKWYFRDTSSTVLFGQIGDVPVPGDYDADGDTDLAVFRDRGVGFNANLSDNPAEWFVRDQPKVTFGQYGDIPVPGNYDSDPELDLAVWRPSTGSWIFHNGGPSIQWGEIGDIPVPGNYDSDPQTDLAVWRPKNGTWYFYDTLSSLQWGQNGDIPLVGNFDADPQDDKVVYRPSNATYYIHDTATSLQYGVNGDIPLKADFDNDGQTNVALYRPNGGEWHFHGVPTQIWGLPGDIPVPANYDSDGNTDVTIWRPGTGEWWINGTPSVLSWGINGDIPVPGDYDADAQADPTVFRPSNSTWYVHGSSAVVHGQGSDVPVPANYFGSPKDEIASWRPSDGGWRVRGWNPVVYLGQSGDKPVPGNYDSDPEAERAVYRPSTSTWIIEGQPDVVFGQSGDIPVPGNYDSDPETDLAVWRPSTGMWYVQDAPLPTQWGQNGDRPVVGNYDSDPQDEFAVFRPSTSQWYFYPPQRPMVQWGQ